MGEQAARRQRLNGHVHRATNQDRDLDHVSASRTANSDLAVPRQGHGLALPGGSGVRPSTVTQREAVELLRAVAEGVGLLRVRGDRLEAASLRNAWSRIDETLRAGLTFAAWCHRVH